MSVSRKLRKKLWAHFEMIAKLAASRQDERSFLLGAVGIRKDGVMVQATNGPSRLPCRLAHAEARLCRKLTPGSIVYVVRVRLADGKFGMARPCLSCQKILKSRGIKKVYYSINSTEYGVMEHSDFLQS